MEQSRLIKKMRRFFYTRGVHQISKVVEFDQGLPLVTIETQILKYISCL